MHSGKRSETGILTIDRHHLIFSYTPAAHGGTKASAHTPSLSAESSAPWIPYPMISRCTLRPRAGRSPALRIRCRDFQMMAFHFLAPHERRSADETAREVFFELRGRCCPHGIEDMLAFHFDPPKEELAALTPPYDAHKEFARMGIGVEDSDGPGAAWRISEINKDYSYSATYPSLLCIPRIISDNILKYGGVFRSKSRVPALAYLHFNGGSITRCSQPLVGLTKKRSVQDEKLVSAIFSSHTPALTLPDDSPEQHPSLVPLHEGSEAADASAVDSEIAVLSLSEDPVDMDESAASYGAQPVKPKVYGSTRSNLIVDARPYKNMLANRVHGGGIEDPALYKGTADIPVQVVFLDIENIHVMRKSLQMVVDSFGNADYIHLPPDQSQLKKSRWLDHISTLIDGSELIARAVGLAGSHVLTHCSDGWDRTSQVSALAQIMLDPHYRTLDGFITLIQKDFLSFGHKFKDRDCVQGSEKWFEIENERIALSQSRDENSSDPNSLNTLGTKALNTARNWFDKNRNTMFRKDHANDETGSRPASPPPNPVIHSSPMAKTKGSKKHGTDENEMAPIFHQFLDTVYQMQRQYPHAFEFNERFLLRLLYQTYACQYGEFLFNNEKERSQHRLPSVWPFFLARRKEFTNPEYAPKDAESLLFPKKGKDQKVAVRWWSRLFGREDEEMNVMRTVIPSVEAAPVYARDDTAAEGSLHASPSVNDALRGSKSTPNLAKSPNAAGQSQIADVAAVQPSRPLPAQQETDLDVLARYTESTRTTEGQEGQEGQEELIEKQQGIRDAQTEETQSFKLDFAAFAAQNAFRD
ncbi:phosphatases II [Teratosphaeria nubilosa]|uniref:Phosphatases II n=1 Tax=Teratosphaeria nubilosa TaxID=161662 RepID=A0A6G1L611_9PEZI|nr:phosphatases II [Teratosphaeria nubilosa]